MLKPEQVPNEAIEAACKAYELYIYDCVSDDAMRLAIAAALNVWPGMSQLAENDSASIREMAALILPLPQEASDE